MGTKLNMTTITNSISSLVNVVLLKAVFLAVAGLCLWYGTVGGLTYQTVGLMLLGALSLLLFEGHALPVAHDKTTITFNHGWRTARVPFADLRIISVSGGAFKSGNEYKGCGLVLEGKRLWQWYFLYGDPSNDLLTVFTDHGLELPMK